MAEKKTQAKKAEYYYTLAHNKLKNRDLTGAHSSFNKCISYDFRTVDCFFYIGRIRYQLNDFAGAVFYYERVIDSQPDNAAAYNNMAIAFVAMEDYERALIAYNKAIENEPADAIYYSNRGLNWLNLDSPNNAILDFTKAIKLKPDYAKAYLFRGNVEERHYNFQNAMNDFTRAVKLSPRLFEAYVKRGSINVYFGDIEYGFHNLTYGAEFISYAFWHKEERKGDNLFRDYPFYYDKAVNDFSKAIRIQPKKYEAYIRRASTKLKMSLYFGIESGEHKLHEEARNDALKAVHLSDGTAGLYVLACAESRLGDRTIALSHLNEALEIGERSLDYVFNDKSWENLLDDLEFSAIIQNHQDNIANELGLFDDDHNPDEDDDIPF